MKDPSIQSNGIFFLKFFKNFNFGDDFILDKCFYNKPIFRIRDKGWISKTCNMNRGIKQGYPISTLLYLLVAEMLSLKLKSNNESINISSIQRDIKNIQHADEITLALKDIKSLDIAITTVEDFCKHAGSNVNA